MKLKLQYSGHLLGRTDSLEKTLVLGNFKAGGEGDDRGWLHGITDSMDMRLCFFFNFYFYFILLYRHEFEQASGDGEGQEA